MFSKLRLMDIMTKKNFSAYKLWKTSKVAQSTISNILNGNNENPTTSTLEKLAKALECDVSDFFDKPNSEKALYRIPSETFSGPGELMVNESNSSYSTHNRSFIEVPIVGCIRAGEPILASNNIQGYYPMPSKNASDDKIFFYLVVQGDSMNMYFEDGDLILVEKTPCIENGDMAIVLIDGQDATVKKITQTDNMITLIPCSTNPVHVPHMYDLQKDNIEIVGKVKGVTRMF